MEDIDSLREREKELQCLYRVQQLTFDSTLGLETVLQEVVNAIGPGWQRCQTTGACITYLGRTYQSEFYDSSAPHLVEVLRFANQTVGQIRVSDSCPGFEANPDHLYLPEERQLLKSIADLLNHFLASRHLDALGQRLQHKTIPSDTEEMLQRTLLALSHELRNPLTVISADLDLLRENLPNEERQEIVGEMQGAVAKISTLLADLILFLRAETGIAPPLLEDIEPSHLVGTVVSNYARHRNLDNIVFVPYAGRSPLNVKLNQKLTERILHILLDNAVRYSESDVIQISVSSADSVVVSVKDQGRGIDEIHHSKLFEQFYRLEDSRDRFSGGVGLGLPLARALAKSQNCSLELTSHLGQGTEVQFIIPQHAGLE